MALSNTTAPTAWGDTHAYVGDVGLDGEMGANLADMGIIDEAGITFTLTDGTRYDQKDINGKLWDVLRQEPSITITVPILRATELLQGEFWDVEKKGETLWVKSMVQTTNKSFRFANPKAIGSVALEAPVASVSMGIGWEVAKGWVYPCTFDILNTGKDGWFGLSTVTAQGFSARMSAPAGGTPVK